MKKTLISLALLFAAVAASAQQGMSSVATPTGGYSYSVKSAAATSVIKSGYGTLHAINVNTGVAASTITVYDALTATGTPLAVIDSALGQSKIYDIAFTTGLTVVIVGTPNVTFSYK